MTELLLDYKRLMEVGTDQAHAFQAAAPFPHAVIDDFLPPQIFDQVVRAYPAPDALNWSSLDTDDGGGRVAQQNKLELGLGKRDVDNEMLLAPVLRYLMLELNSPTFLNFLSRLTGVKHLLSDPKMIGAGLHQTLRGGRLRVHSDFLAHPVYGLDRRLNLLLYLNAGWQTEWAGQLELWNEEMSECVQRIEPIGNRCVIFCTSETSYHGYSAALNCPDDHARRSLAMYYYTSPMGRDNVTINDWPETRWQVLPGEDSSDV